MVDWQSWVQLGFWGLVGLMLVIWIGMHLRWHTKATPIASTDSLTTALQAGRPTLLYFYSNF
jgi:hypothetical protein